MLQVLVRLIVQSIASAAVNAGNTSAPGGGRAYYSGVIATMMFLPVGIFLVLLVGGFWSLQQGSESSWTLILLALAGLALMGWTVMREFWKRSVQWNDQGAKFRWMNGEADLKWSDIEKVEVKTLQRNYARIRFRDGRTFGVSAYLTGGRELLNELAAHGVAFYKWGTTKPVVLRA